MAEPGQPEKAFPVSWDQFHRDARALAWRLPARDRSRRIVCVTRGGLVPAAIVARELGISGDRDGVRGELRPSRDRAPLQVLKGIAA